MPPQIGWPKQDHGAAPRCPLCCCLQLPLLLLPRPVQIALAQTTELVCMAQRADLVAAGACGHVNIADPRQRAAEVRVVQSPDGSHVSAWGWGMGFGETGLPRQRCWRGGRGRARLAATSCRSVGSCAKGESLLLESARSSKAEGLTVCPTRGARCVRAGRSVGDAAGAPALLWHRAGQAGVHGHAHLEAAAAGWVGVGGQLG